MGLLQEHNLRGTLHGTEAQLELYALGRLPDAELLLLEEHLLICAACRDRLDVSEDCAIGFQEALALEPAVLPAVSARSNWWAWLPRPALSMGLAFAALVLMAGVFSAGRTKLAPSASLQLAAMRGEMPVTVPAQELVLTLSDSPRGRGIFRVEIVNAVGSPVWSTVAGAGSPGVQVGLQVKVRQPLTQGDYFVRLYDTTGKMLREYGFRVRA